MRFARYTFATGGILGILALAPMYLLETQFGIDNPPPITHPEFYYGFIGIALAFQIVFLIIASDPLKYRPLMLAAIVEKFSFGLAVIWLFMSGRVQGQMFYAGLLDTILGMLFVVSYFRTARHST
jgi:hypothetical protein